MPVTCEWRGCHGGRAAWDTTPSMCSSGGCKARACEPYHDKEKTMKRVGCMLVQVTARHHRCKCVCVCVCVCVYELQTFACVFCQPLHERDSDLQSVQSMC